MKHILSSIQQHWDLFHKKLSGRYSLAISYAAILLIAFFYFYHILLFEPPQSVHRWRQTDSASITLNLYEHGMHFFQPEVHSLRADDYTTGRAACEAPVLYYLVALFYKVFGPHDYVYRIINTIIFLIGLGWLFKLSQHLLKSFIPSLFVTLLIFVSPVMAYYGNNFLPESAAISMVFGGWWQYVRYLNTKRYRIFLIMVILFTLAGLLKVTFAINLAALTGVVILRHLKLTGDNRHLAFPKPFAVYVTMFSGFVLIAAWYIYAVYYNKQHESNIFLTSILPWWSVNKQTLHELTQYILQHNITMYYSKGLLYFLGMVLLVGIIFFRRIPRYLSLPVILLIIGDIIYINLYYCQFQYHDYYVIVLYSTIVLMTISFLLIIKSAYPGIFHSWFFSLLLVLLLAVNVHHARQEMKLRYYGWKLEYPFYKDLYTIRPYLRSIGVKNDDRIVSIPDYTNCYTLYMMRQAGNILGDPEPDTKENIEFFISKGAKYLVVNDTSFLKTPELEGFLTRKVGEYNQTNIFRIDDPDPGNMENNPHQKE